MLLMTTIDDYTVNDYSVDDIFLFIFILFMTPLFSTHVCSKKELYYICSGSHMILTHCLLSSLFSINICFILMSFRRSIERTSRYSLTVSLNHRITKDHNG